MADGVAITSGAGTTIATDDVSGTHYQRVKLVDGTLDSTTAIPASTTSPANGTAGLVTRTLTESRTASGTLTANGQSVTLTLGGGQGVVSMDLRGTWAAGTTLEMEATVDGSTWLAINPVRHAVSSVGFSGAAMGSAFNGIVGWFAAGGWASVRVRVSAFVATTSIVATLRADVTAVRSVLDAVGVVAKATQYGTALEVQQVRDAGRVHISWYANADTGVVAGPTTEAMMTMRQSKDGAAATTASSWTVTSGKRMRLTSLLVTGRHTAAATGRTVVRWTATGAVATTSPIITAITYAVAANAGFGHIFNFPEGFELSGTMQMGVSNQGSAAFAELNVQLCGYEF